jgi:membrane-associated phospholipid phosphatase
MKRYLICFIFLPVLSYCQTDSLLKKNNDLIRFADGFAYTFTAPARWEGKDWLTFGGVVTGAAVIALLDEPTRDFWQQQDSDFLDGVERIGYHYGKPYSANLFAGGFYLVGWIIKDDWTKDTGLALGTSLLYCGLVHSVTKSVIGRARPRTNEGFLAFDPFTSDAAYHSLPSGHVAVAVAISRVIATRVKSRFVKILCYTMAATTCIGRMYSDSHWLSDVAVGGALGWFSADIANKRINANKYGDLTSSYKKVTWQVFPNQRGLSVVGKF